jgi:hypothetical protein
MVISVGGDGSARVGMMTRPACCSRAVGALQARLGLAGPAWAVSPVLCPVDDRSSVVEVGSSCRLRSCCPLSQRCRVPPPYRPCAIGLEEMGMLTSRPWWGLHVGGEAWWWHSFASELFFVGGGREKSRLACSTLTWCRFRVAPFLPRGHHGKPPSTLL